MKTKFHKSKIPQISREILKEISKTKNKKAKVVTLSGDLGVGKTTITQELGKLLGIKNTIVSPTFVIMKIYTIKNGGKNNFKKLIHIDAYRLDSSDELSKIGWEEIIEDKENLIVIEWPERVAEIIPDDSINISISHIDENQREIEF